jgi:cytochrome c-type biogenesis protein CcmF
MIILALVLPIGAMMPWKRARLGRTVRRLVPAFVLALAIGGLAWSLETGNSLMALIATFLGSWLVLGSATELWTRAAGSPARLRRLPRADWGKATAHSGLGITFIGIGLLLAGSVEDIRVAQLGQPFTVDGYEITLQKVEAVQGPNYTSTTGTMVVKQDGKLIATMHPEKRIYPVQRMPTTEAAIHTTFLRDIYLVIGDPQQDGGYAVRTYIKPFADWIWAGAIIMALGGLLSLSDRRYRVAAGARKTSTAPTHATPAE